MKGVKLDWNDGNKKDYLGNYGNRITGIFPSRNNLNHNSGSCQVSSAVWCGYALAGMERHNPHVNDIQLIESKTNHYLGNHFFAPLQPEHGNNQEIIAVMKGILTSQSIMSISMRGGADTRDNMIDKIVQCKRPCLVWMDWHMVAAYARSNSQIYFYDNTIGLAKCDDVISLKDWAEWACKANDEHEATWKCVQCLRLAV